VERDLLARYIDAHQRADVSGLTDLVRDDIRITMPPMPWVYDGVPALAPLMQAAFGGSHGDWLLVPTMANRLPAAANYLRAPGDEHYRAFKIDVVRCTGDRIAEVTTFGNELFAAFDLPPTMTREDT
jgi:hypothetical protein